MLVNPTVEKLQAMRLTAMAEAFTEQLADPSMAQLSFEERFALMVDRQWTWRENRALDRRLKNARLKLPACLEDINYRRPRGLDRSLVASLATGRWIQTHHNLIIVGPCGVGKTFLACTSHPFSADKLGPGTVLFVIFLCAIWGGLSPALKIFLEGVPPFGAAAFRFLIGLVSLLIWGSFKRIRWWRPAVTHRHLLAFGALFVFQISVFNLGTELTSSSHSIVFLSTNPLFVALVAHFLIPNDRLNLRKGCGLMLAFLGSWVIFAGGAEFHGNHLLGDLLVLLAGFLLGIVMAFSKFLIRHLTAFEVVVWQMIYGVPAFFLLSFWMEQEHSYNVPASVAVALFYQGAIVAAFCFVAWTGLLRRHSVSQVSAFNSTTPLLGVLLSWALLAEPVSSGFVLGVLLIALGIYLVARGRDDWGGRRLASKPVAGVSMAAPPPETLTPSEKETSGPA